MYRLQDDLQMAAMAEQSILIMLCVLALNKQQLQSA